MKGEKPKDAERRLTFLRQRGNRMLEGVQSGRSYRITIDGATHATFSDEEILSGGNATRPRFLLDLARTYLREFFNEVLNGRPSIVFTGTSDPAVQIQVFSGH